MTGIHWIVLAVVIAGSLVSYVLRGALLFAAPTGLAIAAAYHWYITDNPADHQRIGASELSSSSPTDRRRKQVRRRVRGS